jgi:tRNA(Ile)-lysidine synthase
MTVEELREQVRRGGLLTRDRAVVSMLSGGRDSVCLLDVAVSLCGAERVRALHVNYGLRPESDGDESHCRELCERLGVDLIVARSSRRTDAIGNFHAWARDFRYRAARELAERLDLELGVRSGGEGASVEMEGRSVEMKGASVEIEGNPAEVSGASAVGHSIEASSCARAPAREGAVIATGHTATDQVETILYRLAASPGRRALLGMPASEGRLVRPFLGLPREATGAYCRERNLAWREDASNDSERYARARVRHGLLPALQAVHPAACANVLRTADLLREETELLDALVTSELGGLPGIAIERLRELPPALQRLVVIRLAEDATGGLVPQAGERVAEILALGARGGRAELHVGGLASALIEQGELRMVAIPPRAQHSGQ